MVNSNTKENHVTTKNTFNLKKQRNTQAQSQKLGSRISHVIVSSAKLDKYIKKKKNGISNMLKNWHN